MQIHMVFIVVGITRVQKMCKDKRHFPPLLTPPYHPELQPIEDLWRDVKGLVVRQYLGGRTMSELKTHVTDAFKRYGSAAACAGKIAEAIKMKIGIARMVFMPRLST